MKLTKLKKVLLSLLLLNTLVACKYQVDFEQLDSDGNVIINNLETIDQHAEILEQSYDRNSEKLELKVLTNSYVGELKGDLKMSVCTKSYPATCHAKLIAYSQRIKSEIDFGLPDVMVKASLTINLGNLEGVGTLLITDDSGKTTTVNLDKVIVEDRIHRAITIESVKVDGARGTFTINAKHQICDGPGELELDYLNYTQVEPQPHPANITKTTENQSDEPLPMIHPILPREVSAQLIYRVKGGQPELACAFAEGFFIRTSKTFSFRDAGVTYGQSITVFDITKKLTRITYKKDITNNGLLPVSNVRVDLKNSILLITSSVYVDGKVRMKPCLIADPAPGSNLGSYQKCEADFVASGIVYNRNSIVAPAERVTKVSLNEVGLGQNNSTLVLKFQGGQAVIRIDRLGKVSVQIHRLLELRQPAI